MVQFALQISADLENVEELLTNYPNYPFFLKLICTNCGDSSNKWHDLTEAEKVHTNSRNPNGVNFYMKCKMCSRENTIDVVEKSNEIYKINECGEFKTIVIFDCRGWEPTMFSPRSGWIVRTIDNGTTYENVDLSDDDWVEYDEKTSNSIGVYNFASRFIKVEKKSLIK